MPGHQIQVVLASACFYIERARPPPPPRPRCPALKLRRPCLLPVDCSSASSKPFAARGRALRTVRGPSPAEHAGHLASPGGAAGRQGWAQSPPRPQAASKAGTQKGGGGGGDQASHRRHADDACPTSSLQLSTEATSPLSASSKHANAHVCCHLYEYKNVAEMAMQTLRIVAGASAFSRTSRVPQTGQCRPTLEQRVVVAGSLVRCILDLPGSSAGVRSEASLRD